MIRPVKYFNGAVWDFGDVYIRHENNAFSVFVKRNSEGKEDLLLRTFITTSPSISRMQAVSLALKEQVKVEEYEHENNAERFVEGANEMRALAEQNDMQEDSIDDEPEEFEE